MRFVSAFVVGDKYTKIRGGVGQYQVHKYVTVQKCKTAMTTHHFVLAVVLDVGVLDGGALKVSTSHGFRCHSVLMFHRFATKVRWTQRQTTQ